MIYAFTALLASAFALLAAPPEIQGPEKVDEYKLVRLRVTGSEAKSPGHIWDIYPFDQADIDEHEDGSIAFTGPPGTYQVVVRVIDFETKQIATARKTVQIGKAPQPPPPGPPPVPPGPTPDGKFGLRKASRDASVEAAGWKELAASIRSHASAVGAGAAGLKNGQFDPATALAELGTKNVAALSAEELKKWEPWDKAVMTKFYEVYKAGLLKTRADWVDAFLEVADGLEDPKK